MNSPTIKTTSIALAAAAALLGSGAQAGVISDSNPTASPAFLGDCGTAGAAQACVGAWNLDNVDVQLVREDGTVFSTLSDFASGTYASMNTGESFVSAVKDTLGNVMAKVTGKVWPIGEPTGIKAVNGDTQTKNGKPQNCLINSSYLGADVSTSELDAYLDSTAPEPVICSSGFQSHKRFKVAMQPATVAAAANGAAGQGIDLVFNVADGGGLTPYQVFSKINNYTDKRLKGYRIVVGRGKGADFQSASDLGIADKLHLSLGIAEGSSSGSMGAPDGSDLFHSDGLATFSHGLFGTADDNFPSNGFFDTRTAGFDVEQLCTTAAGATAACPAGYLGPDDIATLQNADTIQSTTVLASHYTTLFGDWLPSKWQPSGVFYDDDNDPTTDPVLMAWWNGTQWVGNNDSGSAPIPAATLQAWGQDPLYEVAQIEDVLNLGINYIVKVGDDIDNDPMTTSTDFTVRIVPVVADTQDPPSFLANAPAALTPPASGGGGCAASTGDRPVDPVLPLLASLGLLGWALRRRAR